MTQNRNPLADELAQGTWHIARSSLSMWRQQAGALSFCPLPDGSVGDFVTAQKDGEVNHTIGVDTRIDIDGWQWEWRGKQPLTFFVRSRWRFVAGDTDKGWAAILFEKTIYTSAGVDICSRSPTLDAAGLEAATAACAADIEAREYLDALFEPPVWNQYAGGGR